MISRWTLKEAYLKYIGRGFHEPLAAVEVFDGRIHHNGRPVPGLGVIQAPLGRDHVISLIYENKPKKRRSRSTGKDGIPLCGSCPEEYASDCGSMHRETAGHG